MPGNSDADLWVIVPNWEKFQHYKDRTPVWLKVHLELFERDDYLELTPTARALLHCIWAHYALARGVLRASRVQGACNLRATRQHWESLNRAGFIQLSASKPLALAHARARSREDFQSLRGEETRVTQKSSKAKTESDRISTLIRNGAIRDLVDLTAELADQPVPDDVAAELRAQLTANGADQPPEEDLF